VKILNPYKICDFKLHLWGFLFSLGIILIGAELLGSYGFDCIWGDPSMLLLRILEINEVGPGVDRFPDGVLSLRPFRESRKNEIFLFTKARL